MASSPVVEVMMETESTDVEQQSQAAQPSTTAAEDEEQGGGNDDYQVDFIPPLKKLQRPNGLSVPELLAIRQGYGVSTMGLPHFCRPRTLLTTTLASKIAWNSSRLQNMILTVGPGTPAAIVDLSVEPRRPTATTSASGVAYRLNDSSSSSSSSSCSEDEEEEEEDDDDVIEDDAEEDEEQEQERTPDLPHSPRSGSSSASSTSTTSPKRTYSNRIKNSPEVGEAAAKDDMNLSGDDAEEEEEEEGKPKVETEAEDGKDKKKVKDAGTEVAVAADSDEEMMGFSDVEADLQKEEEEKDKAKETDNDDEEELESLTDREKFYLEVNQAEENRMQFSEDEEEGDDDDDDDSDEGGRPPGGLAESTDEDDHDEADDDADMADFREMAAQWFAIEQAEAEDDDDDDEESDEDDDDDDSEEDRAAARIIIRRRIIERSTSPVRNRNANNQRTMKPSLRHGGCINTAAWMQAGWRLSTVSASHYSTSYNANYGNLDLMEDTENIHAISSEDCPTQLVTSGDDRLVKFWDVRHAMGSTNPLPWGRNTHCPFAYVGDSDDAEFGNAGYKYQWREFYRKQQPVEPWQMFGNVLPLATLQTGHRGNVFHVTPMWQQPGKVATCGADGYLRLGDVEATSGGDTTRSSIVISPEYFDDTDHMLSGLFSLRPGMCFSHHFLNSHVGLLCSERGLRKFDTRLPPRQQERRALIGGSTTCKACAVWTASSTSSVEEVDSTYVFVGGTGAEVALCDLRMTGGDSSPESARIVCQYLPRGLKENEEVSVSGLDLSRDKRELLVSYESDQIYTFPIFPNARSAAGPTLEEIDGLDSTGMDDDDNTNSNGCMAMLRDCARGRRRSGEDIFYNELASYGGHLNRFTFLKNAKYAGPNDEYICTGSDSGHAWIYERSTGAVVSLLNADHSTCNGVVPHPSLPLFITYGIDSTAKLWRGTTPVDSNVDDSPRGRSRAYNGSAYEMSTLTRDWDTIEQELSNIEQELVEADAARADDDSYDNESNDDDKQSLFQSYKVLPDQVLSRKELINTGQRRFYTPGGAGGSRIGNDLHSLPDVLRRNQYECIRAAIGDGVGRRRDLPVESDLKELMRRVSLIRLRHQADRQGMSGRWNEKLPWIFKSDAATADEDEEEDVEDDEANNNNKVVPNSVHPADLIPDSPSDWIPYDPEMSKKFNPCGISFNVEEYGNFYRERYQSSDREEHEGDGSNAPTTGPWRRSSETGAESQSTTSPSASETAYKILHETARVLKDGGNEALRKGDLDIAARRYDKAIRYCSVAFMSHHGASTYGGKYEEELMLISMKVLELNVESDHTVTPLMLKWSPLLKVLISTRLNLSMLLLKQAKHQKEVPQLEQAKDQARHALRELQPFCTKKGKICMLFYRCGTRARLCSASTSGKSTNVKTEILKEKEPNDTYEEAKTLEAKAYFRLGSAQSDMGEYGESIKSFDKSIECTLELNPDAKLDSLVVRRLAEAKREKVRQSKRHRKKFRMMFAQEDRGGATASNTTRARDKKSSATRSSAGVVTPSKGGSRRRTTVTPIVSPSTPASSGGGATALEDRGTQSE